MYKDRISLMYFSKAAAFSAIATAAAVSAERRLNETSSGNCTLQPIPLNADDFDEPAWEAILEIAFPTWATPANGCPRLDALGGKLMANYSEYPVPEEGKWNSCYYTKAFAGLDPKLGGYPTPIDTRYPYEFAAPFSKQPGDGSTHHCTLDAVDIGACPKLGNTCDKDCATITDEYGIGHIPPFVPLAAIKKAYSSCTHDVCNDWFDFDKNGCNIVKEKLDELVIEHFGEDDNTVKYQPPILIDGKPSSTYYRLEYLGQSPACDDGNCRGPHYCTKDVADAGVIWGDFCPYVQTGEDSGQYRHPHLALAALELWMANQCMPDKCAAQWLDSPNGKDYGKDPTMATSITWAEMDNNTDPMAQPVVPYIWPNSGSGIYPGLDMLYGDKDSKDAEAPYVTQFVDVKPSTGAPADNAAGSADNTTDLAPPTPATPAEPTPTPPPTAAATPSSAFMMSGSLASMIAAVFVSINM